MLLLHSFPLCWWTWRRQLETLHDAGYRAVAMDLRGYGASDKPPGGYDGPTLTADVAAVIRSMGASAAVVVGHGIGGWLAWALPYHHPDITRGIGVVASPHPRAYHRARLTTPAQAAAHLRLLPIHRPYLPERFVHDPAYVDQLLRGWAAPGSTWPDTEVAECYTQAMAIPFAAHCALDAFRWLLTAPMRLDGRRYLDTLRDRVEVPVLALHGSQDRLFLPETARRSERFTAAGYRFTLLADVGHFVQEEGWEATAWALVDWLDAL